MHQRVQVGRHLHPHITAECKDRIGKIRIDQPDHDHHQHKIPDQAVGSHRLLGAFGRQVKSSVKRPPHMYSARHRQGDADPQSHTVGYLPRCQK